MNDGVYLRSLRICGCLPECVFSVQQKRVCGLSSYRWGVGTIFVRYAHTVVRMVQDGKLLYRESFFLSEVRG